MDVPIIRDLNELVHRIHRVIQNLPEAHRAGAYVRVVHLMKQMPSDEAIEEIMAILEPGFKALQQGRV